MDEVCICKEDLDVAPPRERPEFEALEGEEDYCRQIRKASVVGTWVLFDWHEDETKHARRQRLQSHGNVEINDPEEAYFSDMYKAAFAELFETVYGHSYTYWSRRTHQAAQVAQGVDDDDDDEDDEDEDDDAE